jgi:hypothetical protein
MDLRSSHLLAGALAAGCGPVAGDEAGEGSTSSGADTSTVAVTSASTSGVDSTAPADSSDGSDGDSTTGLPVHRWGEEELLTILEGDPSELGTEFIVEIDGFLHVSNAYSTLRKHWVIDAATGAVVAPSPLAPHVVVPVQLANPAGERTGKLADAVGGAVGRRHPEV